LGILLVDRAVPPRIWAKTVLIDPEANLRGRYVSLRIEAEAEAALIGHEVLLIVQNGHLSATRAQSPTGIAASLEPFCRRNRASYVDDGRQPPLDVFLPRM
jgi:hypothetical protein